MSQISEFIPVFESCVFFMINFGVQIFPEDILKKWGFFSLWYIYLLNFGEISLNTQTFFFWYFQGSKRKKWPNGICWHKRQKPSVHSRQLISKPLSSSVNNNKEWLVQKENQSQSIKIEEYQRSIEKQAVRSWSEDSFVKQCLQRTL